MKIKTKRVWLNLMTGEFSCSWEAHFCSKIVEQDMNDAAKDGWKLIEYRCLNDDEFEFSNLMKIR
jgi:hypothetical protein